MKALVLTLSAAAIMVSCGQNSPSADTTPRAYTEISVTHVEEGSISQQLELQAETEYLHTTDITAPVNGFIRSMNIQPGQRVGRGGFLFSMVSAEQNALGMNTTPTVVRASRPSVVSAVGPQNGSYVTEGSVVCTLIDMSSLVFKVKVPTEYSKRIHEGTRCTIVMPDGQRLASVLSMPLMQMAVSDQTIDYVARANISSLPAGLVAKALVSVGSASAKSHQTLPLEAVQSDDNMSSYWIMKLTSDSTVAKVPVTLGNRNSQSVEILSPQLSPRDRIVQQGAYGLTEDALVRIK